MIVPGAGSLVMPVTDNGAQGRSLRAAHDRPMMQPLVMTPGSRARASVPGHCRNSATPSLLYLRSFAAAVQTASGAPSMPSGRNSEQV